MRGIKTMKDENNKGAHHKKVATPRGRALLPASASAPNATAPRRLLLCRLWWGWGWRSRKDHRLASLVLVLVLVLRVRWRRRRRR